MEDQEPLVAPRERARRRLLQDAPLDEEHAASRDAEQAGPEADDDLLVGLLDHRAVEHLSVPEVDGVPGGGEGREQEEGEGAPHPPWLSAAPGGSRSAGPA